MSQLYCANPYSNQTALGLFNPGKSTAAERAYSPSMPLRGRRMDIGVTAAVSASAFAGAPRGLSGLGDWASDLLTSVTGGVTNIVDSVTGRGAARDQANAAAQVAALQAQARIAEAQSSQQLWGNALPAVGIAVAAAIGLGLVIALKK